MLLQAHLGGDDPVVLGGEIQILDTLLHVVVESRLPELYVLPDCVVLDESVDELYDSLTELPPEGAGQGQESRGHSVHVNIVVILQSWKYKQTSDNVYSSYSLSYLHS